MKKLFILCMLLLTVFLLCTACNKDENNNTAEDESITEITSLAQIDTSEISAGAEYINNSVSFAGDKIKEYSFEGLEAEIIEDSRFDKFECYTDLTGNVKNVGYDENGKVVFEGYEIYENGDRILYVDYNNGIINNLVIEEKAGTVDFTFDNGECVEYTLTEKLNAKTTAEGAYKITHYNADGYVKTVICDINGKIISN